MTSPKQHSWLEHRLVVLGVIVSMALLLGLMTWRLVDFYQEITEKAAQRLLDSGRQDCQKMVEDYQALLDDFSAIFQEGYFHLPSLRRESNVKVLPPDLIRFWDRHQEILDQIIILPSDKPPVAWVRDGNGGWKRITASVSEEFLRSLPHHQRVEKTVYVAERSTQADRPDVVLVLSFKRYLMNNLFAQDQGDTTYITIMDPQAGMLCCNAQGKNICTGYSQFDQAEIREAIREGKPYTGVHRPINMTTKEEYVVSVWPMLMNEERFGFVLAQKKSTLMHDIDQSLHRLGWVTLFLVLLLGGIFGVLLFRQKRAEAVRWETEARLSQIAKRVPGVFFQLQINHGREGELLYISPRLAGLWDGEGTEMLERSEMFAQRVWPEDWTKLQELLIEKPILGEPCKVEFRLQLPRAGLRWISGDVVVTRQPAGLLLQGYLVDTTKERIREQELQRLSLVASKINNGVVLTNAEGHTEWINEGFTRLTGYVLDEVRGKKPGSFLQGPLTSKETVRLIREAERAGKSFKQEILNYHKDGSPYWVEIEATPVLGEDGQVAQYIAIENDITERKQAEETLAASNARLSELHLITAEASASLESKMARTLEMACRHLGMESGMVVQIQEQRARRLVQSPMIPELKVAEEFGWEELCGGDFLSGKRWSSVRDRKTAPPALQACACHPQWESFLGALVQVNNQPYGMVCLISRQPRAHPFSEADGDFIQLLAQWIGYEIGRQMASNELEQAAQKAHAASEAKTEFLANISHEIRTPMNGILGMLEVVQQTSLAERQRGYLRTVTNCAESLLVIINDILDLSKIEAGKLELESAPFDVEESVETAISLFALGAEEKGVRLSQKCDLPGLRLLQGDSVRFRQILINLLSNAVKFTNHGTVKLELTAKPEGEEQVLLQVKVRDTGIGISPEIVHRLFKPFSQADSSTTRQYGGTGLGLVICQHLVEKMGGKIEMESDVGRGTEFRFCIRLARVKEADSLSSKTLNQHEVPATGKCAGWKVLVVDDNEINLEVTRIQIETLGIEVETVRSGPEALVCMSDQAYHAVLLDCQMPEMDGYETVQRRRELERRDPSLPRQYIIALTANAFNQERQRCLDAGMDEFVTKPIKIAQLRQVLQRCPPTVQNGQHESTPLPQNHSTSRVPFNVEALSELREMHEEAVTEITQLLDDFTADGLQSLQEMLALPLDPGPQAEWRRRLHKLKGVALSFSMDQIGQEMDALEHVRELPSVEEYQRMVKLLRERLADDVKAVRRFLQQRKPITLPV